MAKTKGAVSFSYEQMEEGWKDKFFEMCAEGKGVMECLRELKLSKHYHQLFMKTVPEYAEIMDEGKKIAEAWWEKTGRENLSNKDFKHALYIYLTVVRFKWDDGRFTKAQMLAKQQEAKEDPMQGIEKPEDYTKAYELN